MKQIPLFSLILYLKIHINIMKITLLISSKILIWIRGQGNILFSYHTIKDSKRFLKTLTVIVDMFSLFRIPSSQISKAKINYFPKPQVNDFNVCFNYLSWHVGSCSLWSLAMKMK